MEPVIVTQKANCRNCYKCIRSCPQGAIAFSDDQARVLSEECILCGRCVEVCPQGAQQVQSDLVNVRRMLSMGLKVYASVAPSWLAAFPDITFPQFSAALKKLGFTGVEETAAGAAQVSLEYARLMAKGERDNIISTCCPSLVLLVERQYPDLTPLLAPVVSPAVAHSKMLRSMFGSRIKTVFIGPCPAKHWEKQENAALSAVLLFEELKTLLSEKGVAFGEEDTQCTETHTPLSRLYPSPGGIIATIPANKRQGYKTYAVSGVEGCKETLEAVRQGQIHGYFLELNTCLGSCAHGPGISREKAPAILIKERLLSAARKKSTGAPSVSESAQVDLTTQFHPQKKKERQPREAEIAAILAQTGKVTKEDLLNCGACGYPTCRDKAVAVWQGKADVRMCLPYMREKAESMSNLIIEYAPSAILLLSPEEKLLEYNHKAMEMLGIRGKGARGHEVQDFLEDGLPPRKEWPVSDQPAFVKGGERQVRLSVVEMPGGDAIVLLRDVTREEEDRTAFEKKREQTLHIAQEAVDRQMRMVQQVARLLGETTGETKAALLRMEQAVKGEKRR